MEADQLRVVLPEKAELAELSPQLFAPGADALPGLWDDESVTLGDAITYFRGGHAVTVSRDGYDEVESIPQCAEEVVRGAIRTAVSQGLLWLTNGPTSVWHEPVPEDALTPAATLRGRPERIPATSLVEDVLPVAWYEGSTNGVDLTRALSQMRGEVLPGDSCGRVSWRAWTAAGFRSGTATRWTSRPPIATRADSSWNGLLRTRRQLRRRGQSSSRRSSLKPTKFTTSPNLAPELMEASAGYQLKFRIQIVLDDAPEDVRIGIEQLIGSRLETDSDGEM